MWRKSSIKRRSSSPKPPQSAAAWYGLARLYLLTGKYTAAERWINKALATSPNDETLKQMLAAAEAKQLPDELRRQIDVPGMPESSPSLDASAKGWQQFNAGDMRSAEKSFRTHRQGSGERRRTQRSGLLPDQPRQRGRSQGELRKVPRTRAQRGRHMNGLARCLKAEGNEDEAIAVWEKMRKAFQVRPPPPSASPRPTSNAAKKRKPARSSKNWSNRCPTTRSSKSASKPPPISGGACSACTLIAPRRTESFTSRSGALSKGRPATPKNWLHPVGTKGARSQGVTDHRCNHDC